MSVLAAAGSRERLDAERAYTAGMTHLQLGGQSMLPAEQCSLKVLEQALEVLITVAPRAKRQLIHACAACIASDREITVNEAELMRAIAAVLDCPMPPLLPGQPLV